MQAHDEFPGGINVNFVEVQNKSLINLETWEKGIDGFSLACGTGSCASVVAANQLGLVAEEVEVVQKGGSLKIKYDNENVFMEGPVSHVFDGEINLDEI